MKNTNAPHVPATPAALEPDALLEWTFALLEFPQGTAWSSAATFVFQQIHGEAKIGRPAQFTSWHAEAEAWHSAGFTPATYELLNCTVNATAPKLLDNGSVSEHHLATFGLSNGKVGFRRGKLNVSQWRTFPQRLGTEMTSRIVKDILLGGKGEMRLY